MIRSDIRNKEIALGRIKRLASSGLPLEPFARALFELLNDAIPHNPNRVLQVGREDLADIVLGSNPETMAMVSSYYKYPWDNLEFWGAKISEDSLSLRRIWVLKDVWTQDEMARSDAYRSEGYNVVFRPIGWHHFMHCVFREEGRFLGRYPLWRSPDQKPFTRQDRDFLHAVAPHMAHAVKVAGLKDHTACQQADFSPLSGWHSGVIMMDSAGAPIAVDSAATRIFHQLGILDGLHSGIFSSRPLRDALDYIALTLNGIFSEADDLASATAPVYRLHHHRSGIVLKLRGIQMLGSEGAEYFTVLVERGETTEHRRRRIIARWGLSDREAEVLSLIGDGKTGPEIAIVLGISHDTARKHTSRIFEKLGVETRGAAASIAREAYVDTTLRDR